APATGPGALPRLADPDRAAGEGLKRAGWNGLSVFRVERVVRLQGGTGCPSSGWNGVSVFRVERVIRYPLSVIRVRIDRHLAQRPGRQPGPCGVPSDTDSRRRRSGVARITDYRQRITDNG